MITILGLHEDSSHTHTVVDHYSFTTKATCGAIISGVKISMKLKECIWWIVENRGRPWEETDQ